VSAIARALGVDDDATPAELAGAARAQVAAYDRLLATVTDLRAHLTAADAELAHLDCALGLDTPGLTRSAGDRVAAVYAIRERAEERVRAAEEEIRILRRQRDGLRREAENLRWAEERRARSSHG
jgi:hypothetical protein